MRGHFERVPHAEDLLPLQLEKLVQSMGAFDFNRIEDMIDDPNDPGTVYLAETGRANQEITHGRIYQLEVDPRTLGAALSVCSTRRRVTTSSTRTTWDLGHRARDPGGPELEDVRVQPRPRLRLASDTLTPVARTDPDQAIVDDRGPGAWESSGVVDVSDAFGPGWWLLNVQAHYAKMRVPNQSSSPTRRRARAASSSWCSSRDVARSVAAPRRSTVCCPPLSKNSDIVSSLRYFV